MSFAESIEADAAVLSAMDREMDEIAEMVRGAHLEFNGHRDEFVPSGLDRETCDALADRILQRRRTTGSDGSVLCASR